MVSYALVAEKSLWVTNAMLKVIILKKWEKIGVKSVEGLNIIVIDEAESYLSIQIY